MCSYKPLVVFDTGGAGGDLLAEFWVASRGGILIASAQSTLGWYACQERKAPVGQTNNLEMAAIATQNIWNSWFDEQNQAAESQLRDDRGRLLQLKTLLEKILGCPRPEFLDGLLGSASFYAVTLGELGIIYWKKVGRRTWSDPIWCAPKELSDPIPCGRTAFPCELCSPENRVHYRTVLPDEEIRNVLGSGDVARAGFVASLTASMYWQSAATLQHEWLEYAAAWANWFGATKATFFSIEDFLDAISLHQEVILGRLQYHPHGQDNEFSVTAIDVPIRQMTVRHCNLLLDSDFHPAVQYWKRQIDDWCEHPEKWYRRTALWKNERGLRRFFGRS